MHKRILVVFILLVFALSACGKKQISPSDPNNVFVCTGDYSERYHMNKACDGLKNCKASIEEISKNKAVNDRKTMCSMCK